MICKNGCTTEDGTPQHYHVMWPPFGQTTRPVVIYERRDQPHKPPGCQQAAPLKVWCQQCGHTEEDNR